MVKTFFFSFLFFVSLYAFDDSDKGETTEHIDPLKSKIQSFLSEHTYNDNIEFIELIFEPKSAFYKNERVDSVKVVQTLKENGLLNLFFTKPQEIKLNFKTSGAPLFFVKIMSDTLRNIGYFRYVTVASNRDTSEFIWNIALTSEYVTDPLILEQELQKSNSHIVDISRNSKTEWTYVVDISHASLNIPTLQANEITTLKRSLYAHWLNVSNIKEVEIKSSRHNTWYPYIAYYDASLHLLKVLKENYVHYRFHLKIPQNAKYMKIADRYTLKDIRDELVLYPSSRK